MWGKASYDICQWQYWNLLIPSNVMQCKLNKTLDSILGGHMSHNIIHASRLLHEGQYQWFWFDEIKKIHKANFDFEKTGWQKVNVRCIQNHSVT